MGSRKRGEDWPLDRPTGYGVTLAAVAALKAGITRL